MVRNSEGTYSRGAKRRRAGPAQGPGLGRLKKAGAGRPTSGPAQNRTGPLNCAGRSGWR